MALFYIKISFLSILLKLEHFLGLKSFNILLLSLEFLLIKSLNSLKISKIHFIFIKNTLWRLLDSYSTKKSWLLQKKHKMQL